MAAFELPSKLSRSYQATDEQGWGVTVGWSWTKRAGKTAKGCEHANNATSNKPEKILDESISQGGVWGQNTNIREWKNGAQSRLKLRLFKLNKEKLPKRKTLKTW
jgi:hypothetical protein